MLPESSLSRRASRQGPRLSYAYGMEVQIRDAIESDAEAISPLLLQLMREPSTAEQIRARLRRLGQTGVDRVLVAVAEGRVVGLAGLHVAWMVHVGRPTARLMSLVVDEGCRGGGSGGASLKRAAARPAPGPATAWSSPVG